MNRFSKDKIYKYKEFLWSIFHHQTSQKRNNYFKLIYFVFNFLYVTSRA